MKALYERHGTAAELEEMRNKIRTNDGGLEERFVFNAREQLNSILREQLPARIPRLVRYLKRHRPLWAATAKKQMFPRIYRKVTAVKSISFFADMMILNTAGVYGCVSVGRNVRRSAMALSIHFRNQRDLPWGVWTRERFTPDMVLTLYVFEAIAQSGWGKRNIDIIRTGDETHIINRDTGQKTVVVDMGHWSPIERESAMHLGMGWAPEVHSQLNRWWSLDNWHDDGKKGDPDRLPWDVVSSYLRRVVGSYIFVKTAEEEEKKNDSMEELYQAPVWDLMDRQIGLISYGLLPELEQLSAELAELSLVGGDRRKRPRRSRTRKTNNIQTTPTSARRPA